MKHVRIISWILALALVMPCLPMVSHAAGELGFSVSVSRETALVGSQVEVTASLEGYDTASIAGLQVDITGIDPDVLEVVGYASVIADKTARSNKASYNTEKQRVRLLYFREEGTLAPCKDVLKMTVQINSDLTGAGSITLPVTVLIVTLDGEEITWNYTCTIQYSDVTVLDGFEYTLDAENGNVVLTKYTGTDAAVVVAPSYTIDGTAYTTVLASETVFRENSAIKSVELRDGVKFSGDSMYGLFYNCANLTSVDMNGLDTAGVTDMSYMFANCKKLVSVDMTDVDTSDVTTMRAMFSECRKLAQIAGYEDWDTSSLQVMRHMFNYVQSMETIDLSKWDLSQMINSGWCFQYCYAKYILLPDNLKTISAGFLNHATKYEGTTFTIPAGVEKIGYAHTIYDFSDDDFVEFIVAEGNENYVAIDGILYSADGKEMLAVPRGKTFENNTYVIPEGVEFLGELSFSRNYNIHTVVLPNSFEIEIIEEQYDPRYVLVDDSGNLNVGSNLNIAIYCYTGITDYAVKEDNPRYTSIDGILYSKDMTTVVAVPTRYNKHITIPEGVTTWAYEAMWATSGVESMMSKSTGVTIPSTLTDIAPDQMAKLNRMREKYKTFEIVVHENNPVYTLDEAGKLMLKPVIEAVARNTATGVSYETAGAALSAAGAGETVILLADCAEPLVVVPAGVVFDLNGYVMETDNVVSFGAVTDTAETVGGIRISCDTAASFTKLQPENGGYLPIYDTAAGMYKFFVYAVESNTYIPGTDSVTFAMRVVFDNDEAYNVLANTEDSCMDFCVTMNWTGVNGFDIRYQMSAANLKKYAVAAYDQLQQDAKNSKTMTLKVTGIDKLGSGAFISAAPSVVTVAEVTGSADVLRYDIP